MFSHDQIRGQAATLLAVDPASIAIADNLIQRGLDSIRMMRLAGSWRKAGFRVSFAELAAEPTVDAWHRLLAAAPPSPPATEPASPDLADGGFALAPMQHAYWIGRGESHELGGVAAHLYAEFDGAAVDPDRLAGAVAELISIHPMLRARFRPDGTQQVLLHLGLPTFSVTDLRERPAAQVADALAQLREKRSHQKLRVAEGQVLEISLTLLPDEKTRLHCDLDMLAADAMSYRLLMADLAALYAGCAVTAPGYRYREYLAATQAQPDSASRERDRRWWQERLARLPSPPALPVVPARDQQDPYRTVRRQHWLGPEIKAQLLTRAYTCGVTPAMALAAVFAEVIGQWSSEQQFLLNLPLFQRSPVHPDIDRVVGDFSSSVLLEVDLRRAASVVERAWQLQHTLHTNGSHADYSGLDVLRDLSRSRGEPVLAPVVFTSALNLGELFADSVTESFGEPVWIVSQGPQVLLDAQVTEFRGGLLLNWDVRDHAFPPGVIDAMFASFAVRAESLARESTWETPAASPVPARQQAARSGTHVSRPACRAALHEGLFAHAREHPDAPALVGAEGTVSYAGLARQALTVAAALRNAGVREGDSVAVQLPKGHGQVVAVLGVLATGAAYVPIGYQQPAARRSAILDTAQVRVAICHDAGAFDGTGLPALTLAQALACRERLPEPVIPDSESVAYVIFTSGSTGVPKGVEVPHRAAMNTIAAVNAQFGVCAADRALVISALEFDASVYDIFGLLAAGGSLVTMSESARADATQWLGLIQECGVTVLNCVPSMLDMLLVAAGPVGDEIPLRAVLLGGDWVAADLPGRLAARVPDCRFAGLGGATETAIHFSVCEVAGAAPANWATVPFGKPLANVVCRVVNSVGQDCPDWVTGELWVGGAGVAHGYRGDAKRTAARFVRHGNERWYRTGDLARYWPDGTIEFLGRADDQVQLRGYRVELGEVEAALRELPGVARAVAVVLPGPAPKLAAVLAAAPDALPGKAWLSEPELLAALGDRLPPYMIPERLLVAGTMPLTANGKLDRRAVAALLVVQRAEQNERIRPDTDLERALVQLTGQVLGREIGVSADFFAAGGDSVLGTALIVQVREWLDTADVTVADLFAARTAGRLAARLLARDPLLEAAARVYLEVSALSEGDVTAALG